MLSFAPAVARPLGPPVSDLTTLLVAAREGLHSSSACYTGLHVPYRAVLPQGALAGAAPGHGTPDLDTPSPDSADTTVQPPPVSATALAVALNDLVPSHLLESDGDLSPVSEQGFFSFLDEDLGTAPPAAPPSCPPVSASLHPCTGENSVRHAP